MKLLQLVIDIILHPKLYPWEYVFALWFGFIIGAWLVVMVVVYYLVR